MGITKSPVDFFVLGDVFMRGFYTIHSDETGLIGLVPHVNSSKKAPKFEAVLPVRPLNATAFFGLTPVQITIISAVLAVLSVGGFLIWRHFKKKKDEEEKRVRPAVGVVGGGGKDGDHNEADLLIILK